MYYYQLMRVCLIKYGQQVINQIKVYIEVFRFNNMLLLYFLVQILRKEDMM